VGTIDGVAVGCHVVDPQCDQIAATQLAVDGKIEQRQVARAPLQLQLGADRPHVAGPQGRLRAGELALVPHRSIRPGAWGWSRCHSWSVSLVETSKLAITTEQPIELPPLQERICRGMVTRSDGPGRSLTPTGPTRSELSGEVRSKEQSASRGRSGTDDVVM